MKWRAGWSETLVADGSAKSDTAHPRRRTLSAEESACNNPRSRTDQFQRGVDASFSRGFGGWVPTFYSSESAQNRAARVAWRAHAARPRRFWRDRPAHETADRRAQRRACPADRRVRERARPLVFWLTDPTETMDAVKSIDSANSDCVALRLGVDDQNPAAICSRVTIRRSGRRRRSRTDRAVVKEDKHRADGVSAEALGYEVLNGRHLLARDVELLDDLVNAQIVEVLHYRRHRQTRTAEHAPPTLSGTLSTAGHWDQSSAAMNRPPRPQAYGIPVPLSGFTLRFGALQTS